MRTAVLFLSIALAGAATPLAAAPCKDAKGKFIKCPPVKAGPCKDAKGKFVKCGTPGAVSAKK